jgi:hypothetical protein
MFAAALVHLGADFRRMEEAVVALDLGPVAVEAGPAAKGPLQATAFRVHIGRGARRLETPDRVAEVLDRSGLPPAVADRVRLVYRRLAEAEADVHGEDPAAVHFHELGSPDTIVDVTAAAVGLDSLGVDSLLVSPVNVGGGTVVTAHGPLPVPAPATLRLLRGFALFSDGESGEKTTPTGAAIVTSLGTPAPHLPPLTLLGEGYGAGAADFTASLNVLQLVLGEGPTGEQRETAVVLECNIDDMNPQVCPYLVERLLEEGAQEAYLTPVVMKKGRPGFRVSVVSPPGLVERLAGVLIAESTTIGLRLWPVERIKASRRPGAVATPWGEVRIKLAEYGSVRRAWPEFEECRRIARETGRPLVEVMRTLSDLAARTLEGKEEARG